MVVIPYAVLHIKAVDKWEIKLGLTIRRLLPPTLSVPDRVENMKMKI